MAAKQLLPGFGSAYTSEAFTTTQTGTDTIDCSRCGQLALQVSGTAATGTVDLEQSFVSGKWSILIPSMGVTDATTYLLPVTEGPFGVLRLNATVASGTCTFTIVGYPVQPRN